MTIRTRLSIALVLLAVIAALAGVAFVSASHTRRVASEPGFEIDQLQTIQRFHHAVSAMVKDMGDVASGAEDAEELVESTAEASRSMRELERRFGASGVDGAPQKLRGFHDKLAATAEQVMRLVARGELDEAQELAGQVGEDVYEDEFVIAESHATDQARSSVVHTLRDVESSSRSTGRLALVMAIISVVVFAACWLMIRAIQRRLTGMVDVVVRMRGGDLAARSTDVESSDELGNLGRAVNDMAENLDEMIAKVADQHALEQEMALASRLQQAIVPPAPALPGLEIHGVMTTATQVGGDYYDVIPDGSGGWIAIGDVAGHGVNAGIVMLMAQSAVAAAVRANPAAGPAAVLSVVNHVLYENVRARIGRREHMTLSLLRYHADGRIVYAGAHLEMLLRRAGGALDVVPTPGVWMGILASPDCHLVERELRLAPGDTLVLHTDGLTEATTRGGDLFGLERLCAAVGRAPDGAAAMCRDVLDRVRGDVDGFDDDATLLVVHRPAVDRAAAA